MSDGAFLLGIGCQKGGTSWLFEYLHRHPQVDVGPRKEMHVLDALFLPSMKPWYDRVFVRVLRHASDRANTELPGGLPLVAASLLELGLYFDHFHYRLLRDPSIRLTGELTPAYAALPAEVFALVRDAMAERGVPVKVLFVMRDPVQRCWSQVRMARRDNPRATVPESEGEHLLRVHASTSFQLRTRYDRTLAALDAVFGPEQCFVDFYETLFTAEGIQRLCGFLGLDALTPDLEHRVHATPKGSDLPEAVIRAVANTYAPVYSDVIERFGRARVERCWPSVAHLAAPVASVH